MNLVWIQLEAAGFLLEEHRQIREQVASNFGSCFEFEGMICSAPSTVMASVGMLTGVYPVRLTKNHVSKKVAPNETLKTFVWESDQYSVLTDIFKREGYQVMGFHLIQKAVTYIPFFHDKYQGVTDGMEVKNGHHWANGVVSQRLYNLKDKIKGKKNALFFHFYPADFLDVMKALDTCGIRKDNTIFVIAGDHGHPKNYAPAVQAAKRYLDQIPGQQNDSKDQIKGYQIFKHDWHLSEENLRVSSFLHHPEYKGKVIQELTSALDFAPTVLSLFNIDPKKVLPKADGVDLSLVIREKESPPKKRTIRVDNRYVEQRQNRIIALVDENYRYIFRFNNSKKYFPFYKFNPEQNQAYEELYDRFKDLNEMNNLAGNKKYSQVLKRFRHELLKNEKKIQNSFLDEELKNHLLKKRKIPRGNPKLLKHCLLMFESSPEWVNSENVALYGSGQHTRDLLQTNILDKGKIVAIFDDNPKQEEIFGIPVISTDHAEHYSFDVLLISSGVYEQELSEKANKWIKNESLIISLYQKHEDLGVDFAIDNVIENSKKYFDNGSIKNFQKDLFEDVSGKERILERIIQEKKVKDLLFVSWEKSSFFNRFFSENSEIRCFQIKLNSLKGENVFQSNAFPLTDEYKTLEIENDLHPENFLRILEVYFTASSFDMAILIDPPSFFVASRWLEILQDQMKKRGIIGCFSNIFFKQNFPEWDLFCRWKGYGKDLIYKNEKLGMGLISIDNRKIKNASRC